MKLGNNSLGAGGIGSRSSVYVVTLTAREEGKSPAHRNCGVARRLYIIGGAMAGACRRRLGGERENHQAISKAEMKSNHKSQREKASIVSALRANESA